MIRIFFFPLFISSIWQVCQKLFEVGFRCNAVDRHNFYHPSIQFAVPDITLREGLNFQSLNQQVTGFYWIAEEIVVIDVIDLKTGILCFLLHLRIKLISNTYQTLCRSLNCTEIDVCTNKTPAKLHRNCLCCATPHKAVKYNIAWI